MTLDATSPGPGPAPHEGTPTHEGDPRRWVILAVLCVNLVMIVAAVSSTNVALPHLAEGLGASQTQLQWIVDAYALAFAGLLLPAAALGDRFGRKGAMQLGLAIFAGFSLVAALSDSSTQLIVARGVMGLGAALVMPTTLSILTTVFPPHERARAIAIWAAFAGAGGALGPLIGGWLLNHFYWGSVFGINVVIGGVALIAGGLLVPTSRDPHGAPMDPVGAVLSIVGLGSLVFAVIEGPERGWTSPITLVAFAVSAVALVTFVRYERAQTFPMLDMGLFRNRAFSTGVITITLAFFSLFGMFFTVTQYFQFVLGWSPLQAGLAMIPNALAMILVAPRSTRVVRRFGPRATVVTGLSLHALGFALLSTAGLTSHYLPVLAGLLCIGTGSGMAFAPTTAMIMAAVPIRRAGMGSGVNDTAREVGGAMGIAVLGSLLTMAYKAGVSDATEGLPAPQAEAAERSVGQALQLAGHLGPRGAELADQARTAFLDGMHLALRVGALTAVTCAVIVWFLARGITRHEATGGH